MNVLTWLLVIFGAALPLAILIGMFFISLFGLINDELRRRSNHRCQGTEYKDQ